MARGDSTPSTATVATPLHEQPLVYQRRWFTLSVMCLSLIMVVMAVSGLNVALPTIQRELQATGTQLLWIVDSYAIVFAGLLLVAGALGDRFGRKGALESGLVVFALGALIAAVAGGTTQVIVGRAVMGAGAAFIMPATLSIITAVFPPQERTKAIAIWAGFAGAGGAIGPIVSGILLTGWFVIPQFWWGATFLVNIPVILGVLVAVALFTPSSKESEPRPLDFLGGLLSIVGIAALLYGIIEGPRLGWTSTQITLSFLVAAAVLGLFLWWESRIAHPMLPLSFFKNRRFTVGTAVVTFTFFVMFGFFFLQTLFLQFVLGYSALAAGVATIPLAFTVVLVSPRSAALSGKFGSGPVMATGFGFLATGLGLLAVAASPATPYGLLAVVFVLLGFGLGLATAPATGNIMTSVPLDKAGVGSAMNDETRELGGALGIAIGGSVVATIYASTIDLVGLGVPARAQEIASESIGAAFGVANQVGGEAGAGLIVAAQEAFADAFATTMGLGAAVAVLAGLATWWVMRRGRAEQLEPSPGSLHQPVAGD